MAEDDDRFSTVYIDSIKLRAERYRLRAEVDAERQQARRIRSELQSARERTWIFRQRPEDL
ncbi:hypothetical protein [Mesorhizobium sp. WSM3879]|uniref:hypothetical protein n=1 Tax=Mesorhizobium sp. WSM3879 TaxID=2029406 RepID=UPI0011800CBB|nr:hypothetical protein [Mesorhizobium sp. WSM3879]